MKKLILALALLPTLGHAVTLEQCRAMANDISFIHAADMKCEKTDVTKRHFDAAMEVFYSSGCTDMVTKAEFSLAIDRDILSVDDIVKGLKKGVKFCKQPDVVKTYLGAANELISFDK